MRPIDQISAELADLEDALKAFNMAELEPYTGAWITGRGLESRRAELIEELEHDDHADSSDGDGE